MRGCQKAALPLPLSSRRPIVRLLQSVQFREFAIGLAFIYTNFFLLSNGPVPEIIVSLY